MAENSIISAIKGLFEVLLDYIYPERCIICDEILDRRDKGNGMCGICSAQVESYPNMSYDEAVLSCYIYEGAIRDMIHRYKFRFHPEYCAGIARIMLISLSDFDFRSYDVLVPVPIHPSKKRKRGFNQVELIVRELGKATGVKVSVDELVRIRKTKAQVELNSEQRAENVKNAFSVVDSRAFKGKRVILVDDIYTTGSTARECRNSLMESGAKEVKIICLSRGRRGLNLDECFD